MYSTPRDSSRTPEATLAVSHRRRLSGLPGLAAAFAAAALMILGWQRDACAATRPATVPALDGGPVAAPFWERFERADELREAWPDSVAPVARAELARDPESLLGHWLLSAALARGDSAGADAARDSALALPGRPGPEVLAGCLFLADGRSAEGRAALDRARDAYLAADRPADAARAALWKGLLDRATRRRPDDPAFAEAESLAQAHGARDALAEARLQHAVRLTRGDQLAAGKEAQAAVEAARPLGGTLLALAHRQAGIVARNRGLADSSEAHHLRAVAAAAASPLAVVRLRCLQSLAVAHHRQARYADAIALLDSALALAPERPVYRRAGLLSERGNMLRSVLRLEEARASFAAAAELYERNAPDLGGRIHALDGLGVTRVQMGEIDEGRRLIERALEEARRQDQQRAEPFLQEHLAEVWMEVGDFERAEAAVAAGLLAARRTRQPPIEAALLSLRADLLLERGRPERALAASREAVRLSREAGARRVQSRLLFEGGVLARLGRSAEALRVADTLRTMALGSADASLAADAEELAGEALLAAGRPEEAVVRLRAALARSDSLGARRESAGTRRTLGQALLAAGRPGEAAKELEAALRVHEDVGRALVSSEERGSMHAQWQSSYVDLATARARLGDAAAAFRVVDRSRAREMRRLFGRGLPGLRAAVPTSLAREAERIERDLAAAQSELVARQGLEAGSRSLTVGRLAARCERLKGRWADAMRRIERAAPDWTRAAGVAAPLTADAARRQLRPGEALLAYLVGEERSLAVVVTPGGVAARELPWGEESLRVRVEAYLRELQDAASGAWRVRAAGLADTLLPAGLVPETTRMMLLVPDASLHHLPFETLRPAGAGGSRALLLERCAVISGDAPGLLLAGRIGRDRQPGPGGGLAAFGDPETPAPAGDSGGAVIPAGPLPYARREVESLGALWPGGHIYTGAQATEGRVLDAIEHASVLHVAAHGFVDHRHPRFSGLVLSRDLAGSGRPSDGLVQAWEVLERRGALDLVTLSACETGGGRLLRGEGLVGLARAFRIAGARDLLVSLWKVDDAATADLMVDFYRGVRSGLPHTEALRAAKLKALRGADAAATARGPAAARGIGVTTAAARHAHPSAWAAFVLEGEAPR